MAYTRRELQEQIDTLLSEDSESQCTRSLLNGLLSNILDSVTLQDDSANAASVAGLNVTDPAQGLKVSGVKVIGAQQAAIDPLTDSDINILDTGIDTVVTSVKIKINALISIAESHGLIATHV